MLGYTCLLYRNIVLRANGADIVELVQQPLILRLAFVLICEGWRLPGSKPWRVSYSTLYPNVHI